LIKRWGTEEVICSNLRRFLDGYKPRITKNKWYFLSPQGKRYDPDNFSRNLRNANKRAGLKWTCLYFRHTFGSQLAIKGESLYKISALMGNSPEICRRHYAALIPESMYKSVEFKVPGNARTYITLYSRKM
jgi:site-specific recombinase XerD